MELAAKRLERPQFGIEWAQAMHPHFPNIGSAMLISHFSRTVSEWYQATITYFKYHRYGFSYHIIDEPENEFAIGRLTLDPFAFYVRGLQRSCRISIRYWCGFGITARETIQLPGCLIIQALRYLRFHSNGRTGFHHCNIASDQLSSIRRLWPIKNPTSNGVGRNSVDTKMSAALRPNICPRR